jgi:transcriptional regulator EpsA
MNEISSPSTQPFVHLNPHDLEHLALTIEAAMQVRTRAQFFLWAQGALQGFLPHATLLCAHGDVGRMQLRFETFSRLVLEARTDAALSDPANGLAHRMVDDWIRQGGTPCCFSQEGKVQTGRRQLLSDLSKHGLDHIIAHGVRDIQGDYGSFFAFVGLGHVPDARDAYLLELLLPHLHLALFRMLGNEGLRNSTREQPMTLLSKREIQVLHWIKNGKTNPEIGQILGISPRTAKNHVQKIMRKLKVTNRAQAVGKGATLRLVVAGDTV